ncbi:MAG: thymidylate kinase [Pseudomonadota bacterium]|jgi:dTMP kinase
MEKIKFITFEGGEGSGKTTQSKMLADSLQSKGYDAIWTREIGGTEVAEKIRNVILNNKMEALTELLLVMAARRDHIENMIKPAIASGKIVVCDRFIDSTLCYQGNILGRDLILDLHKNLLGGLMPDITFFIDVPVEEGMSRALNRGEMNKFDSQNIDAHERIRENFLSLVSTFSERIHKIDGTNTVDLITKDINNILGL